MSKVIAEKQGVHANPKKALEILRKVREEGPDKRFRGMTEEAVIKALKKTRADIWREKIAGSP